MTLGGVTYFRLGLMLGLLVILGAEAGSLVYLHSSASPSVSVATPSPSPSPTPLIPATPDRLRIPSLSLNSPITPVDLVRSEIGTPCDPNYPYRPCNTNAVGWFDQSPLPGAPGNAILDGHELWYGAHKPLYVPASFTHLYEVKVGDQVLVTDAKGQVFVFRVDSVTVLPLPSYPPSLYQSGGPPSLTLITCNGAYSPALHAISHRLFVHATYLSFGLPATLDAPRPLIPFRQPYA